MTLYIMKTKVRIEKRVHFGCTTIYDKMIISVIL